MTDTFLIRHRAVSTLALFWPVSCTSAAGYASVIELLTFVQVSGPVDSKCLLAPVTSVRNGAAGTVRFMPRFARRFGFGAATSAAQNCRTILRFARPQQHPHRLRNLRNISIDYEIPSGEHGDSSPYRQRRSEGRKPEGHVDLESGRATCNWCASPVKCTSRGLGERARRELSARASQAGSVTSKSRKWVWRRGSIPDPATSRKRHQCGFHAERAAATFTAKLAEEHVERGTGSGNCI